MTAQQNNDTTDAECRQLFSPKILEESPEICYNIPTKWMPEERDMKENIPSGQKTLRVAAAVICDCLEKPTRIFAAARGYGDQKGGWEFPGGKLEPGETAAQALVREIREELNIAISVGPLLHTIEFDYPAFHLSMDCFLCRIELGEIELKEAEAARWLSKQELYDVPWLPADLTLIGILEKTMA